MGQAWNNKLTTRSPHIGYPILISNMELAVHLLKYPAFVSLTNQNPRAERIKHQET